MKAIILLVLGLALLGGAGYGGWILYNTYVVGEVTPEMEAKRKAEEEAKKAAAPVGYVRLPPIVIPAIGANRVEQFVTLVVSVEVVLEKQPYAASNQPRLIDAFISTLYAAVDDKSVMNGALVNIPAVKEKLTEASIKVLGPDVVRGVLVQVVTQRNL